MEREVGGGIGMGNTCKPMAVSFQCMTKFTTNKKKGRKKRFGLICHIHLACHQLTTTYFKHLNNFFQGKCFHKEQEAEDIFQKFIKFGSTDFYATGINKLISHWQIIYIDIYIDRL